MFKLSFNTEFTENSQSSTEFSHLSYSFFAKFREEILYKNDFRRKTVMTDEETKEAAKIDVFFGLLHGKFA